MTCKDFIKILLISYGYDEDMKIDVVRDDFGDIMYDVEAKTSVDEDVFTGYDYFLGMVKEINRYMDERRHPDPNKIYMDGSNVVPVNTDCHYMYGDFSVSFLLDDKKRLKVKRDYEKRDKDHEEYCEFMRPVWKKDEEERPCPNCTENQKDLEWDIVHYQCSKGHNMTCQKLKNWMDTCTERNKKATEEYNKIKASKK